MLGSPLLASVSSFPGGDNHRKAENTHTHAHTHYLLPLPASAAPGGSDKAQDRDRMRAKYQQPHSILATWQGEEEPVMFHGAHLPLTLQWPSFSARITACWWKTRGMHRRTAVGCLATDLWQSYRGPGPPEVSKSYRGPGRLGERSLQNGLTLERMVLRISHPKWGSSSSKGGAGGCTGSAGRRLLVDLAPWCE